PLGEVAAALPLTGAALGAQDRQLRACAPEPSLRGGASLLDAQQACAFQAQARWRLGAQPPATLYDGIPAAMRGRLLHALLQALWRELRDQAGLLDCAPAALDALLERCWSTALEATRGGAW